MMAATDAQLGADETICDACAAAALEWLDYKYPPPPIQLCTPGRTTVRSVLEAQERRFQEWRDTVNFQRDLIFRICREGRCVLKRTERAERVRKVVAERYREWDTTELVVQMYEGLALVTWEAGPDDWAYRAVEGGVDEACATDLISDFGVSPKAAATALMEKSLTFPDDLDVETYWSFALVVTAK